MLHFHHNEIRIILILVKILIMNIYLVGGAVRDQILGITPNEKDWVVVGADASTLISLGFKPIGKNFPVFLHPKTKEEYALARQESKEGSGYTGFSFNTAPNIRLEEDLKRRDLTINAMAMDEQGRIIDPYGGMQDLKNGILRHVSPAFSEDPLRVLRLARFMARFSHRSFTIASETKALLYQIVKSGELNFLTPERIWKEWEKSLNEPDPAAFIETLRCCGALKVIFPELNALFGVPNPPKYHGEIDSGIHTLMTLRQASSLSNDPSVRLAACLHDLGKGETPMHEWPHHRAHEERSAKLIEKLAKRLRMPNEYKELAIKAAKYHLIIHKIKELKPNTIIKYLEKMDAFRQPILFEKILTVCHADFLGCLKTESNLVYHQENTWKRILQELKKINVQDIIHEETRGEVIKQTLHRKRLERINYLLNLNNKTLIL